MADKVTPLKPVPDAGDLDDLWIDTGLGDGITTPTLLTVPVDKPFRPTSPKSPMKP